MLYRQLRQGVADKNYKLIPTTDDVFKYIDNKNKDYYLSVYEYNEDQYKQFKSTGSIAGIKAVTSPRLAWDFDSKDHLETSRQDTISLCKDLISKGVNELSIRIAFSGNKGFHVVLETNQRFTVDQFKTITANLALKYVSYDPSVSDPSRILRIAGTINEKSGLYKFPLSYERLVATPVDVIKELAKDLNNVEHLNYGVANIPANVLAELSKKDPVKSPIKLLANVEDIDWAKKPKFLSSCRWALQNGLFVEGFRSNAFMCLAATYKNLGFEIEHTYRLLKGVAELQAKRNDDDRYPDDQLWNNILLQVYSPTWKNGQYSCKESTSLLHHYCSSLGTNRCKHDSDDVFIEMEDFGKKFLDFATTIEKNTLKTGIEPVDKKVMLTTSMLVGLLGAPSSGKTSLALNFLHQSNLDSINSMFFSLDMGLPLVYLRLIQKHFGIKKEQVFDFFKHHPEKTAEIMDAIKKEYKRTKFSFRSGLSVDNIRESIIEQQNILGEKIKLIVVDYLECLSGPYSDPLANTSIISQQLKDVANNLDVCVLLLLQPQKHAGDPSEPLLSMRNVKGSSTIEQACSVILTASRPGFSAKYPQDDKFISISTVKDRMNSLMSVDCSWEGLTGKIDYLEDRSELDEVLARKASEKPKDGVW